MKGGRMAAKEHARGWRNHVKAEVHAEVEALTAAGAEKAKATEVHAADGEVVINTHGEARFDRDALTVLIKRLEQARQVVA